MNVRLTIFLNAEQVRELPRFGYRVKSLREDSHALSRLYAIDLKVETYEHIDWARTICTTLDRFGLKIASVSLIEDIADPLSWPDRGEHILHHARTGEDSNLLILGSVQVRETGIARLKLELDSCGQNCPLEKTLAYLQQDARDILRHEVKPEASFIRPEHRSKLDPAK